MACGNCLLFASRAESFASLLLVSTGSFDKTAELVTQHIRNCAYTTETTTIGRHPYLFLLAELRHRVIQDYPVEQSVFFVLKFLLVCILSQCLYSCNLTHVRLAENSGNQTIIRDK